MINESVLLVLKTQGLIAFIKLRIQLYRKAIRSRMLLNILNNYDYLAMLVDNLETDENVKTLAKSYFALHSNHFTH